MMTLFRLVAVNLIFTFLPSIGFALSINEFMDSVKKSNLDLQALHSQAKSEKHRAKATGYWDDPFFAAGPDQVPENDSNAGMMRYQISQTIPFPGKISARQKAAEAQSETFEASVRTSERELILIAAQLYARAYYVQAAISANRTQHKLLDELLNSTRSRYKAGTGEHHEYVLSRIEISTLEADHLRLNRELKILKAKMNEMRDAESDAAFDLESIHISEADPNSLEEALKNHPEILAVDAEHVAAKAEVRNAQLSYFPDLVLQGMYMQPRSASMDSMGTETDEPSQWGAMLGISIPIFFYGKQSNLSSAAKTSHESVMLRQSALKKRLQSEWLEAEADLKTAEDLVQLYRNDVVPNTQLAARTGRAAYVARRLPLSQFIEVTRAQANQSLELTAAEIDVAMAKLRKMFLLSNPPKLRLAPTRPSLFGSGSMNSMNDSMSEPVNMGSGMRTQKMQNKTQPNEGSSGSMEGM